MLAYANKMGAKDVVFSPSLARGLAYYTGPVFEVFLKSGKFNSSLGAGGRFDGLIKMLSGGEVDLPATGACFGLDTIYDALLAEGKLPDQKSVVGAYVVPIGVKIAEVLPVLKSLREAGLNADVDMIGRAPSRNFAYIDNQGIPFAVIVGAKELKASKVTLKDMKSGKERLVGVEGAIKLIRSV